MSRLDKLISEALEEARQKKTIDKDGTEALAKKTKFNTAEIMNVWNSLNTLGDSAIVSNLHNAMKKDSAGVLAIVKKWIE